MAKKITVLLLSLILLSSCGKTEEVVLTDYDLAIDDLLANETFIEPTNYDVEVLYDQNNRSFYVIIDNPQVEITKLAMLAIPVIDNAKVGQVPQMGILDDKVSLGENQKGIILSGELTEQFDTFEILLLLEYSVDNKKSVDYVKISNIVLIEE